MLSMATTAQLPSEGEHLTVAQQEWALHSEALWRKAHQIAGANPNVDAGDVHHVLCALELPPSERLRRGLTRVRVRSHAR